MARLGEHLIAAQLVSADKLEQALRAQVVWGGRLGTNLVEVGALELDDLSRALGQQHGVPAALARHFDNADAELQAQLPAEIAQRFSVVPLVRLSPGRIAVVAIDPLTQAALEAVAGAYGVHARDGIVYSVAPEMRVRYHLERVYKIARSPRYLRSRGGVPALPELEIPLFLDDADEIGDGIAIDVDDGATMPIAVAHITQTDSAAISALIDSAIDSFVGPAPDPTAPQGRDRRTYARTLADAVDSATETQRLARIAIKRVAVTPQGPSSLADATRAIKRGLNRDRVAELVIETLERFVPTCTAALLLVVRGDIAIGWKHFARATESSPEVAVPLDQPGIVPSVIATQQLGRCAAGDLGPIDQLLVRELGAGDCELVVAPILIGSRVMCVVAAATEHAADTEPVESVASAAGAAFARLIRDASR